MSHEEDKPEELEEHLATLLEQGASPDLPPQEELSQHPGTRKRRKKGSGCSLLTMLAFTAMAAVLAAILVPNWMRARARGSLTACKSNLKNIGTALEMYSTHFAGKYPASLQQVVPNYLESLPECPSAGKMTYQATFGRQAPFNPDQYEDYYYVECHGSNHTKVSVTGDYPAYNGIQGLIERQP